LMSPDKALFYALICTIGSVLGGIFGYFIGLKGGLPVLKKFVKEDKIKTAHYLFNKYEAWTIFIAGFTPIPYKVFTIAAGVFYINFKKFVVASIFGRGLRFFTEGILLMFFGNFIADFLESYFNIITVVVVVLVAGGYVSMELIRRKIEKKRKI